MPEATKAYRIKRPHFRGAVYYKTGSIVRIPADEKPGRLWVEVTDAEAEAKPYVPADPTPISQKDISDFKQPKAGAKPEASKPEAPRQPEQPKAGAKRPSDRDV